MDVQILPTPLGGTICVPASKSQAHRALICASLCEQPTTIALDGLSQDILATIDCLRSLGTEITVEEDTLIVTPAKARPKLPVLDCCESGSTLRFLVPVVAALGLPTAFVGEGRLPQRPLTALRCALGAQGVRFEGEGLPLWVHGTLRSGRFTLPGDVSSQYLSGLLFALPLLEGDSTIELSSPLESRPYVEMTVAMLAQFDISIDETPNGYAVAGGQRYRSPGRLTVEGDWSNAAFWLCAGALGHEVRCENLLPSSTQGDRAVAALLTQMGARITCNKHFVHAAPVPLSAINIDASKIPDLIPVLCVVASVSAGHTRIYNAARLRLKECDRLHATAEALAALGARIEERGDELHIEGVAHLRGGEVQGYNDHRMVMSMAIAASVCQAPVIIRGAQAIEKSYPRFFEDYQQLGGNVHVL